MADWLKDREDRRLDHASRSRERDRGRDEGMVLRVREGPRAGDGRAR